MAAQLGETGARREVPDAHVVVVSRREQQQAAGVGVERHGTASQHQGESGWNATVLEANTRRSQGGTPRYWKPTPGGVRVERHGTASQHQAESGWNNAVLQANTRRSQGGTMQYCKPTPDGARVSLRL